MRLPRRYPRTPPLDRSGQPLYGACEYARSVIRATEPWGRLGGLAIQEFRDGYSYVYFIGGDAGLIKIGHTVAPLERITAFQMGSPIALRFLALVTGGRDEERAYHSRFADSRIRGEWFERTPELLEEIERIRAQTPPDNPVSEKRD